MDLTENLSQAVFRFLPPADRRETLDCLLKGSISMERLSLLDKQAFEFHVEGEYEDRGQGPQALNHYAWAATALGNAAKKAGLEPDDFYRKAWGQFVDPNNRGHDDKGHELVKENPKLLDDSSVRSHYKGNRLHAQKLIGIAPELRAGMPPIDALAPSY